MPAADSLSQYSRSSSASSPLRLTVIVFPGVNSIPGGVSLPMSVNPLVVSSWPCMMLSAPGPSPAPKSPKVLTVNVPPKTSS